MDLSSRPLQDDTVEDREYDNPHFVSRGTIGYRNGPKKGTTGVRFAFEITRPIGTTVYEVTLTKEELLTLVADAIN